jgi:hypothetical protein
MPTFRFKHDKTGKGTKPIARRIDDAGETPELKEPGRRITGKVNPNAKIPEISEEFEQEDSQLSESAPSDTELVSSEPSQDDFTVAENVSADEPPLNPPMDGSTVGSVEDPFASLTETASTDDPFALLETVATNAKTDEAAVEGSVEDPFASPIETASTDDPFASLETAAAELTTDEPQAHGSGEPALDPLASLETGMGDNATEESPSETTEDALPPDMRPTASDATGSDGGQSTWEVRFQTAGPSAPPAQRIAFTKEEKENRKKRMLALQRKYMALYSRYDSARKVKLPPKDRVVTLDKLKSMFDTVGKLQNDIEQVDVAEQTLDRLDAMIAGLLAKKSPE